jgi:hypothetical protein
MPLAGMHGWQKKKKGATRKKKKGSCSYRAYRSSATMPLAGMHGWMQKEKKELLVHIQAQMHIFQTTGPHMLLQGNMYK